MKEQLIEFWKKNQVFLLGLIAAICVSLQEFISQPTIDWKVIGFAVLLTGLSYLAKEWRGQGLSTVGIVGNLAGVFVTVYQSGNFTWNQFMLQAIIAIMAAAAPDPKSRGYEASEVIKDAKREGEAINPAILTKKP